jgi:hypothetical protein
MDMGNCAPVSDAAESLICPTCSGKIGDKISGKVPYILAFFFEMKWLDFVSLICRMGRKCQRPFLVSSVDCVAKFYITTEILAARNGCGFGQYIDHFGPKSARP